MDIVQKWLWEKAGVTLAIVVLVSVVIGWFLHFLVMLLLPLAIAEIALAIVVLVKEFRPPTA
jgi:hypothetical protein